MATKGTSFSCIFEEHTVEDAVNIVSSSMLSLEYKSPEKGELFNCEDSQFWRIRVRGKGSRTLDILQDFEGIMELAFRGIGPLGIVHIFSFPVCRSGGIRGFNTTFDSRFHPTFIEDVDDRTPFEQLLFESHVIKTLFKALSGIKCIAEDQTLDLCKEALDARFFELRRSGPQILLNYIEDVKEPPFPAPFIGTTDDAALWQRIYKSAFDEYWSTYRDPFS